MDVGRGGGGCLGVCVFHIIMLEPLFMSTLCVSVRPVVVVHD